MNAVGFWFSVYGFEVSVTLVLDCGVFCLEFS